jgi:hypothetical protein
MELDRKMVKMRQERVIEKNYLEQSLAVQGEAQSNGIGFGAPKVAQSPALSDVYWGRVKVKGEGH